MYVIVGCNLRKARKILKKQKKNLGANLKILLFKDISKNTLFINKGISTNFIEIRYIADF